jgi:hypothetical protein
MADSTSDCFVVLVRDESKGLRRPETVERVVATCPSHEEAASVRQQFLKPGRSCIIRCVSETGGGD